MQRKNDTYETPKKKSRLQNEEETGDRETEEVVWVTSPRPRIIRRPSKFSPSSDGKARKVDLSGGKSSAHKIPASTKSHVLGKTKPSLSRKSTSSSTVSELEAKKKCDVELKTMHPIPTRRVLAEKTIILQGVTADEVIIEEGNEKVKYLKSKQRWTAGVQGTMYQRADSIPPPPVIPKIVQVPQVPSTSLPESPAPPPSQPDPTSSSLPSSNPSVPSPLTSQPPSKEVCSKDKTADGKEGCSVSIYPRECPECKEIIPSRQKNYYHKKYGCWKPMICFNCSGVYQSGASFHNHLVACSKLKGKRQHRCPEPGCEFVTYSMTQLINHHDSRHSDGEGMKFLELESFEEFEYWFHEESSATNCYFKKCASGRNGHMYFSCVPQIKQNSDNLPCLARICIKVGEKVHVRYYTKHTHEMEPRKELHFPKECSTCNQVFEDGVTFYKHKQSCRTQKNLIKYNPPKPKESNNSLLCCPEPGCSFDSTEENHIISHLQTKHLGTNEIHSFVLNSFSELNVWIQQESLNSLCQFTMMDSNSFKYQFYACIYRDNGCLSRFCVILGAKVIVMYNPFHNHVAVSKLLVNVNGNYFSIDEEVLQRSLEQEEAHENPDKRTNLKILAQSLVESVDEIPAAFVNDATCLLESALHLTQEKNDPTTSNQENLLDTDPITIGTSQYELFHKVQDALNSTKEGNGPTTSGQRIIFDTDQITHRSDMNTSYELVYEVEDLL